MEDIASVMKDRIDSMRQKVYDAPLREVPEDERISLIDWLVMVQDSPAYGSEVRSSRDWWR